MVTSGHAGTAQQAAGQCWQGQAITRKRGGKPFTCMQEDASCQRAAPWLWPETVPSGGPYWAGAPTPIGSLPGARSRGCVSGLKCPSVWGRLCLSLNVWEQLPRFRRNSNYWTLTPELLSESQLLLTCQSPKIPFNLI